jgi:hypothetical protein
LGDIKSRIVLQIALMGAFFIVAFILAINFIVTVYIEFWILRYMNMEDIRGDLRRHSFVFNSYSYALILVLVFVYEFHQHIYLR